VERVVVVGNVAMHHLLAKLPVDTLGEIPFQPVTRESIKDAAHIMEGIFPEDVKVMLPPMIGGFVGSDALACLAFFGFDDPPGPIAAIDLGTNGEVMVTDGDTILTASTAAGPAFEGVNISCGSRAVDGAIVKVEIKGEEIIFETIGDAEPVGLTGSGLLTLINELVNAGVIEDTGRLSKSPSVFAGRIESDEEGVKYFMITEDGSLRLSQLDIRELQKAKGAIRASVDILMEKLGLSAEDILKVYLTGSFGGQVDVDSVVQMGMIPPVRKGVVETVANGAGLGAAMFLTDEGFALGEKLAAEAVQVNLDNDEDFNLRYANAMFLR
jgi:uncharacterized 2Fe-2S/4Fe-4S cluster protein (DUF4445 family)